MIKCKQCGDVKDDEKFRQYPKTKGRYKVCLNCEKINNKYKYLMRKKTCTAEELQTMQKIKELYEILETKGMTVPYFVRSKDTSSVSEIDRLLEKYKKANEIPEELIQWKTKDLSPYTPDELDEAYQKLKEVYRPSVGVDDDSGLPKYDNTYRTILDEILQRFDEYEDLYYEEHGEE